MYKLIQYGGIKLETNSVIAAIAKENQKLELICNQEIDYADSLRRRKSFFFSSDELSNSCKRD